MGKVLDRYFNSPVFWDYVIAFGFAAVAFGLCFFSKISIPDEKYVRPIVTDLSTVSLTSAGFILTILTILITFKGNSNITKSTYKEDNTLFELFFISDLYHETVRHLKNCIKSLLFIAVLGYTLKIILASNHYEFLFFTNILCLVVIVMTLWRCLLILTKIIKMQNDAEDENVPNEN